MTRDQAIAVRCAQLNGKPVDAALLERAIEVIQATTPKSPVTLPREKQRGEKKPRPDRPARREQTPVAPLIHHEMRYESDGLWRVHTARNSFMAEVFLPRMRVGPAMDWPGPLSVPVPRMNYLEAIKVRERAALRQPVDPLELIEANLVVQEVRRQAMPTSESYK